MFGKRATLQQHKKNYQSQVINEPGIFLICNFFFGSPNKFELTKFRLILKDLSHHNSFCFLPVQP